MKATKLVQAESGLVAVTGVPGAWERIGVSLCDINAGLNALIGIQQALLQRDRTGRGASVELSLFDSAAELMAVPYHSAATFCSSRRWPPIPAVSATPRGDRTGPGWKRRSRPSSQRLTTTRCCSG